MDSIERTIYIDAPVERVWTIVTEPEHLGQWFGDAGASRAPGGLRGQVLADPHDPRQQGVAPREFRGNPPIRSPRV